MGTRPRSELGAHAASAPPAEVRGAQGTHEGKEEQGQGREQPIGKALHGLDWVGIGCLWDLVCVDEQLRSLKPTKTCVGSGGGIVGCGIAIGTPIWTMEGRRCGALVTFFRPKQEN